MHVTHANTWGRPSSNSGGTCKPLLNCDGSFLGVVGIVLTGASFHSSLWWQCSSDVVLMIFFSFFLFLYFISHSLGFLAWFPLLFLSRTRGLHFFLIFNCSPFIFNLLKNKKSELFFVKSSVNKLTGFFYILWKTHKKFIETNY